MTIGLIAMWVIFFLCLIISNNYDRFNNFWIYDYDDDCDQIARFYKQNLRTGKKVKIYSEEYHARKYENNSTRNRYTDWYRKYKS